METVSTFIKYNPTFHKIAVLNENMTRKKAKNLPDKSLILHHAP